MIPEHTDETESTPFINCVIHQLTGAQILYYLLNIWTVDSQKPVVLWCRKGDAVSRASAIRVALSKERKSRDAVRTFELRVSEPWPYTHKGIKGEAIRIHRELGSMMTRVRAAMTALQGKNR